MSLDLIMEMPGFSAAYEEGGAEPTPLAITSNGGESTASIDYDEGLTSAITTVTAEGGTAPYAFSITGGADAAFFEIDEDTGALTPLAAFDHAVPQDDDANNGYVVEVTVTDAALDEVSQTITVNVQAVEEPTVFTLTISDLENYVEGSNTQRFKLDVDTVAGGTVTTPGFIDLFWVGSGPRPSSGVAVAIATQLTQALSSILSGQEVSATDISSGGDYIFTISIPETVGVVNSLTLNAGESQLFPTVTLTESVIQQGVDGVQEVVSITADDPSMTSGDTTSDNNGNSVTVDATNTYTGHAAGSGWTAGLPSGNTVVFTKDAAGEVSTSKNGGNGTVTVNTEGAGTVEVHAISRNIAPTGGTWKPSGAGTGVPFSADGTAIATAIANNFGGAACTADQGLTSGTVLVTATVFANLSDTVLAPENTGLEAPAIMVTIE